MPNQNQNAVDQARRVIAMQTDALRNMALRMDHEFEDAVALISRCTGRVVVIGMGKSGHIGRKIAATMASTGTSAFFVHPAEAFHGDLGMIRPEDVALLISNSGETEELLRLLPFLESQGNAVVVMTGKARSTLARGADAVLDIGVEVEACSNNLAPTSSTTATLVMGDALAVVLSQRRGFKPEDFARFHPGGSLGRKLHTRVRDTMQRDALPFCSPDASFRDVVHTITRGRMGLVLIGAADGLLGIITDGDVRRTFERCADPLAARARDMMSPCPLTIDAAERLGLAESLMREHRVGALVALDSQGVVVGIVQLLASADDETAREPSDSMRGDLAAAERLNAH
jgi:arabinose-5-phosphate isomerase